MQQSDLFGEVAAAVCSATLNHSPNSRSITREGNWSTLHQATRQPNPPPLPAHPGSQNPRGNPEDHVADRASAHAQTAESIRPRRSNADAAERVDPSAMLVHSSFTSRSGPPPIKNLTRTSG
jgi:hypothetical protein